MAGLMDLFITITAQDEASDKIKSITKSIGSGLKTAAKVGAVAVGAVTAGAAAMTNAMVSGAKQVAEYGDNIDKMSQKMGMSSTAYQEWDAILQHSGTSIEGMQRGMMSLSSAAEKGSDAFEQLGISQDQLASMSQEELFAATIEGLQGMESGSERAVLAQKLLGGAAKELGPLLNTSAEETEAMRQRVHALGGVMGEEAVKASAKFQDSLQDMKTSISGLKTGIMNGFLPGMSMVMDGITEIFSGDSGAGVAMVTEGIEALTGQIEEVVPQLIEMAGNILPPLIDAIASQLPGLIVSLLPVLISAVGQIIGALAANLPAILGALWTGIKAVGQQLYPVLAEAFSGLADWFGDKFAEAGDAIKGALGAAFDAVAGIASRVADAVAAAWGKVRDFFAGLADIISGVFKKGDAFAEKYGGGGTGWEGMNAIGNDYVPYDNYRAVLHRGEAVLTAREADAWRRGQSGGGVVNNFTFNGVSQSDLDYIVGYVNRELVGAG